MGRVTSVKPHLSEYEISERLKGTSGRVHRRWLVVWNALVDPRTAKQIARHTGVSVSSVHNLVSNYNRFGPEALEGSKDSKRRRCYFSRERESEFLAPFLDEASAGQICVAGRIKQALENYLGHSVHHSTVYRMLERNQWRKVVPRPVHPQAKEEVKEGFKKTFPK